MLRILLVDDHQLFLDGMGTLISQLGEMQVVATANNGTEAIEILKNKPCEIVIMDINMPQMDGIETTQQVTRLYPQTKILIVSMDLSAEAIKKAIQAGASGYILKNTGKEELKLAIYHLMEGEDYFAKEVMMQLTKTYMPQNQVKHESRVHLTKREREVIKLMVEEYAVSEIAEKLFISVQTVETHRKNLLKKLNLKNNIALVKYAMKHGLDK